MMRIGYIGILFSSIRNIPFTRNYVFSLFQGSFRVIKTNPKIIRACLSALNGNLFSLKYNWFYNFVCGF